MASSASYAGNHASAAVPTHSNDEFAHILLLLQSTRNDVRKEAEIMFNDAKSAQPLSVAQGLLVQLRSHPDDASRALSAVLLRSIFNIPFSTIDSKPKWMNNSSDAADDDIASSAASSSSDIVNRPVDVWMDLMTNDQKKYVQSQVLEALVMESKPVVRRSVIHLIAIIASRIKVSENGNAGVGDDAGWPELFPTLLQICGNRNQQQSSSIREQALLTLEKVIEYNPMIIPAQCGSIAQVVAPLVLSNDDASITTSERLVATRVVLMLMISLNTLEQLEPFKNMIPSLFQVLSVAMSSGEEISCRDALESLVILAEEQPKFLKPHLEFMCSAMAHLSANTNLDKITRGLGVEFLVTITENAPAMIKKFKSVCDGLLPLMVNIMAMDLDESQTLEEWEQNADAETFADSSENEEMVSLAESAIDRISRALKGKTIVPSLESSVTPFLASGDWKSRRAALITISLMAEGCGKKLYPLLQKIAQGGVKFFNDPHPRVRYAAVHLIGQLALDFADSASKCGGEDKPNFQRLTHSFVIPALISAMNDTVVIDGTNAQSQPWRVRVRAVSSLINFCSGENAVESSFFTPHIELLFKQIANIIEQGPLYAKNEAISALGIVAGVLDEQFTPFYDSFMPVMIKILDGAVDFTSNETNNNHAQSGDSQSKVLQQTITLKGRVIECIGLLAAAVGREKFLPDANKVMQYLLVAASSVHKDDEIRGYALTAIERLSYCLEQDFIPFLKLILPDLLMAAQKDIRLKTVQGVDPDEGLTEEQKSAFEGMHVMKLQRGKDSHVVVMDASAMEALSNATRAFFEFSQGLGVHLAPFIPEISKVLVPLIRFDYLINVRISASLTIPRFMDILNQYAIAQKTVGNVAEAQLYYQHAQNLMDAAMVKLLEAMESDCSTQGKMSDIESTLIVTECATQLCRASLESGGASDFEADEEKDIKTHPAIFGVKPNQLPQIFKLLASCINLRVVSRFGGNGKDAVDQEDEEALEEYLKEESSEDELLTLIVDMIGYLVKCNGVDAIPSFMQEVLPTAQALISQNEHPTLLHNAICMYDDVIKYGAPLSSSPELGLVKQCVEKIVKAVDINQQSAEILQSASFGIGVLAQFGGIDFQPYVEEAIKRCVTLVDTVKKNAGNEQVVELLGVGSDNAAMSVYYLATNPQYTNNETKLMLISKWLSWLPLIYDPIESRVAHTKLMQLVMSNDPLIFANYDTNKRMFEVINIYISCVLIGFDEESSSWNEDEQVLTVNNRVQLAHLLKQLEASGVLATLWKQFSSEQQTIIQMIANSMTS